MGDCDNCGTEVSELWLHRQASETMTHRSVAWVCRTCHPSIPERVGTRTEKRDVVIADGGMRTMACPSCGGPTMDGQGPFECMECSWSGTMW